MKLNGFAVALVELRNDPPVDLLIVYGCGLFIASVGGALIGILVSLNPVISGALLTLAVIISLRFYRRYEKTRVANLDVSEKSNVPAVSYVITALSPYEEFKSGGDNLEIIRRLIKHHEAKLQEVYLISMLSQKDGKIIPIDPARTSDADIQGLINAHDLLDLWIETEFANGKLSARPLIRYIPIFDSNSAHDSFQAVSDLLWRFRHEARIKPDNAIIDVTAGSKAISVGLSTAGILHGYPLSYQATKRDEEGKPDFKANKRDTSMVYLTMEFTNNSNHKVDQLI